MSEGIAELIEEIETLLATTGKSKVQFAHELNEHLPESLQKPITSSYMVSFYRWFGGKNPSGEIALGMKKWVEAQAKQQ